MKIYGMDGKKNIVGERVKAKRENKGLTQEELAHAMQREGVIIEQKAISRIELGQRLVPDYELLVLSKALDVSLEWLLTGK